MTRKEHAPMPLLCLYSPDSTLRGALTEQLALLAGLELVQAASPLEALRHPADMAALDARQENVKAAVESEPARQGRPLFLLGTGAEWAGTNETPNLEKLPRPFYLGHFLDRLTFHMDVMPRLRATHYQFAGCRLETQNRQMIVEASGEILRLTEKETAILASLAQNKQPVPRDDLLAAVWGYDGRIDTHTLETHIYQLRRKFETAGLGGDLLGHDGQGYFLQNKNT